MTCWVQGQSNHFPVDEGCGHCSGQRALRNRCRHRFQTSCRADLLNELRLHPPSWVYRYRLLSWFSLQQIELVLSGIELAMSTLHGDQTSFWFRQRFPFTWSIPQKAAVIKKNVISEGVLSYIDISKDNPEIHVLKFYTLFIAFWCIYFSLY